MGHARGRGKTKPMCWHVSNGKRPVTGVKRAGGGICFDLGGRGPYTIASGLGVGRRWVVYLGE